MTWANPLLLAGLAACVLPVVLHLLGHATAGRVEWGAMHLLTGDGGDERVGRWRERLLLAVRCLAVALLAVAFARPSPGANGVESFATVVLVLDASPSMNHAEASTTRFELARRAALDRLGQLRQGDQAGLVVVGVDWPADVALTPDLQAVASQLTALSTGAAVADMAEGVRRARAMLLDAGVDGGDVLLIGDRQRSSWQPLAQSAAEIGASNVVALPIGTTANANAWIESIELVDTPAVVGLPTRVAVVLRNGGSVPQGALQLRVQAGRDVVSRKPVAIVAGGRTRVVRTIRPDRAGSLVVVASVDTTGVPDDDTARLAIEVVPQPKVRRLSAPGGNVPPASVAAPSTTPATVPSVWTGEAGLFSLPKLDLTPADVVIMADDLPDPRTLAAVENYVAAGGGLLLAPGPSISTEAWNAYLWKNGYGFAPAAGGVVSTPPARLPSDVADALLPDGATADWTTVPVRQHWKLDASDATVLARVGSDPLVIDRPFGRGRVITLSVAERGEWSNGGGDDPYAGLTAAIVRRLAGSPPSRNVGPGAAIEASLPALPRDRQATVQRPDGRLDRVPLATAGGQTLFRYVRTELPGRYVVRVGERPAVDWVVRPDTAESDLKLLDDAALAGVLRPSGVVLNHAPPAGRSSVDWAMLGLIGVGGLLAGEALMAGRRSVRRRSA